MSAPRRSMWSCASRPRPSRPRGAGPRLTEPCAPVRRGPLAARPCSFDHAGRGPSCRRPVRVHPDRSRSTRLGGACMDLDEYCLRQDDLIRISAEQGSRFAKLVAGDFNPIHDADSKRFCVPGDLLFALVLNHYGLSEQMQFRFRGMVAADQPLVFAAVEGPELSIAGPEGRVYLEVERKGATSRHAELIEALTRRYVAFSGHNFPHVLQPLLERHGVMFNPERPLIIYDSMGFSLSRLALTPEQTEGLALTLAHSELAVPDKRGVVNLEFSIDVPESWCWRGSVCHGRKRLDTISCCVTAD